jgi:hypothetical protein
MKSIAAILMFLTFSQMTYAQSATVVGAANKNQIQLSAEGEMHTNAFFKGISAVAEKLYEQNGKAYSHWGYSRTLKAFRSIARGQSAFLSPDEFQLFLSVAALRFIQSADGQRIGASQALTDKLENDLQEQVDLSAKGSKTKHVFFGAAIFVAASMIPATALRASSDEFLATLPIIAGIGAFGGLIYNYTSGFWVSGDGEIHLEDLKNTTEESILNAQ